MVIVSPVITHLAQSLQKFLGDLIVCRFQKKSAQLFQSYKQFVLVHHLVANANQIRHRSSQYHANQKS